jgi:hypothetical protein
MKYCFHKQARCHLGFFLKKKIKWMISSTWVKKIKLKRINTYFMNIILPNTLNSTFLTLLFFFFVFLFIFLFCIFFSPHFFSFFLGFTCFFFFFFQDCLLLLFLCFLFFFVFVFFKIIIFIECVWYCSSCCGCSLKKVVL